MDVVDFVQLLFVVRSLSVVFAYMLVVLSGCLSSLLRMFCL